MDSSDRAKLIKAGFTILRTHPNEKKITALNPSGSWALISRHDSKAGMERKLNELRMDEKTILES